MSGLAHDHPLQLIHIDELEFRLREQRGGVDIMGVPARLAGRLYALVAGDISQLKIGFPVHHQKSSADGIRV